MNRIKNIDKIEIRHNKGGVDIATSSITKNFVVSDSEQVERFANAIEESANNTVPPVTVNVTKINGTEDLRKLMVKRERNC